MNSDSQCSVCDSDLTFLRSKALPSGDSTLPRLKIADLFSGCGGLSIGLERAARELRHSVDVKLAVDSDQAALDLYKKLFPKARTICEPLEVTLNGEIGSPPTQSEAPLLRKVGVIDILLGGPPCQGHSNLNNHSRRDDPRNGLYLRMARAAELLTPSVVLIENVPSVTLDIRKTVHRTIVHLRQIGYRVSQRVIDLSNLGVPQKRRRHVAIATRSGGLDPQRLFEKIEVPICSHVPRSTGWAIGGLEDMPQFNTFNSPSRPYATSQSRINWLFDNDRFDLPNEFRPPCHRSDHSYTAMYGRMAWDVPAQTVTTGFNCMGQGRYVHPSRRRVITPHEAARLQMLPDFIDFGFIRRRGSLAKLIGNAAPPPLSYLIGKLVIPSLAEATRRLSQA